MLRKTLDNLPYARPYLIVTAIAVIIFFPTWLRLAQVWLEFEQVLAHGLATAIIFLGLLLIHPPKPSETDLPAYHLTGGLALIGVTLAWGLLELVRIDTLAYLMLPAGLVTVAWALLGLSKALVFLPHVLLLALSLPFWADIVPALVSLASVVVGTFVRWFGITALIEGNSITLPYGRLLIADGCSGIRYFAISILLAMMTSILNDYRWRGWAITLAAAMLIGLIANWVRITILVVVADQSNMQSELLTDHETMGWLVFGAFILPALYFSPVRKRANATSAPKAAIESKKKGLIAVFIAIAIGPLALTLVKNTAIEKPPWKLTLPEFRQVRAGNLPISLNSPDTLTETVWRARNIWVSLAQSQKTAPDDKLVPYLPDTVDKSIWQIESRPENGMAIYRNILTRDRVVMAQWYQVGSHTSTSYHNAKLLQIPAMLKRQSRFALVTVQSVCRMRDCTSDTASLSATVQLIHQEIFSAN